jgi:hypothetical protein
LAKVVRVGTYRLELRFSPNRAQSVEKVSLALWHGRRPVTGSVKLTTTMPSMGGMGFTGFLRQTQPGRFFHLWPPLEMAGAWLLHYDVSPGGARRFGVTVVDRIRQ